MTAGHGGRGTAATWHGERHLGHALLQEHPDELLKKLKHVEEHEITGEKHPGDDGQEDQGRADSGQADQGHDHGRAGHADGSRADHGHADHGHAAHGRADHGHADHGPAEHGGADQGHGGHADHGSADEGHAGHGQAGHSQEVQGHGHGQAEHGQADGGHAGHGQGDHGEGAHGAGAHGGGAHGAGGHGAEGHGHGHGAAEGGGCGARSVAVGLIASVVMLPVVVYLALSDWLVAELTMKMLDTFISIFLAVLWFNTFSHLLMYLDTRNGLPFIHEIVGTAQGLVLYFVALSVAWLWRDETLTMTTFCSVGAHYIAFSGIMAGTSAQQHFSAAASESLGPFMSFAFCFLVVALLAGISAGTFFAWRKDLDHTKLNHSIEHLELDILGLVVSYLITQAVRHAISGEYPGHHGIGHHAQTHEAWQVWFMLGWAVSLTALAAVTLPRLSKYAKQSPWAARGVHLLKVVLIMLVAWGYLLWGEWQFHERLFRGDVMFGHMLFACLATLTCLAALYVMAVLHGQVKDHDAARETNDFMITGISLVAAWSWEHCFNIAFDVIGQEYQVGYGGLVPKLLMSVGIPVVILPVYVTHIRSRVLEIEQQSHGHGHGHGHGAEA